MLEMLLISYSAQNTAPFSLQTKKYLVQNGNCDEFKKPFLSIKGNNSFVQTMSFSFQSLVKVGEISKTFPILDWNINILYSFALIMFLHFRHDFKCYEIERYPLHYLIDVLTLYVLAPQQLKLLRASSMLLEITMYF